MSRMSKKDGFSENHCGVLNPRKNQLAHSYRKPVTKIVTKAVIKMIYMNQIQLCNVIISNIIEFSIKCISVIKLTKQTVPV